MSMMVSFVLSFFPRDVLDEILNLIESVSEDFPSYSSMWQTEIIITEEKQSEVLRRYSLVALVYFIKPITNRFELSAFCLD